MQIRVSGLIEEVASKVDVFQDPDVNKVLSMYMLCVRRNYGGCGIGKKLVRVSECVRHLEKKTDSSVIRCIIIVFMLLSLFSLSLKQLLTVVVVVLVVLVVVVEE